MSRPECHYQCHTASASLFQCSLSHCISVAADALLLSTCCQRRKASMSRLECHYQCHITSVLRFQCSLSHCVSEAADGLLLPTCCHRCYRLDGLVVKVSASGAKDPVFESRLRRHFFPGRVMPVTKTLALQCLACHAL